MVAKIKESSPAVFTTIKIDTGTGERLKSLASGMPVATYLRNLTIELAENMPATMEYLKGGYSLSTIKESLSFLNRKIEKMGEIQVRQFEVLFKNICKLAVLANYTLDAVDQLHPEYNIADDIRQKAEVDGTERYESEMNEFWPEEAG